MLTDIRIDGSLLSPKLTELRAEVRAFIAEERAAGSFDPFVPLYKKFDPAFSRKLGAKGFIGMTWPTRYGGGGRTMLERYIVSEELLAAGCPVRAHWVADRQTGALILNHGTERMKREHLPRMAKGECYVALGLSEPNAGSDLASIKTRAERVKNGFVVNGSKIWTSHAHEVDLLALFAKTSKEEDRHGGTTQFLLPIDRKEITIRPIVNMAGEHEFNELFFDDLFISDDEVIGEVGAAWAQLSSELALERSGPERWMNGLPLLRRAVDHFGTEPDDWPAQELGRVVAHLWSFRQMSIGIAGLVQQQVPIDVEASIVKDLATNFEQEVPEVIRRLMFEEERHDALARYPFQGSPGLVEVLKDTMLAAPSMTIKGGAREVLRGVIARGLGLR